MADPIESLPIPVKDVMELAVAAPDFAGQEWAEVIQDGNSRRHLVARKHSPEFTGNPLAPTPDLGDNSESIATTEYVQNELDNLNITPDDPGEPTNLTLITHTTLDQDGKVAIFVVLDWDDPVPVKPAWTYEVRYTSDGANPDSRFVGEPGAKIRVESGVAYIFKVRTLSKDAKSDWVLFDPITPLKKMIAPPAPTGLARVNGHRWVRLSWDNPLVANPTFYDYWKTIIYRSDTNNFANAVEVGRIDGTRYTDNDGLENGQNYFYWITHLDTSRNESAKHPLSNTAGVQATPRRINDDDTDDTQPGVPTSLVLTPRTTLTDDGRIMLDLIATWSPPSGGLSAKGSYVIWIKDLTTNDVTTQETDRDDRSVTFRVKSSRSYDVKVRAKLGVGQAGNWCSAVTAVMDKKTSYVVVPSGLTATGYHRRVVLNWDEITGVDILDYKHTRIYRATTNNFAAATIVGRPDGTEFVDAGLANNQTYYYWIAHVDTTKNVSVRYPIGPATNNGIVATTTPIVEADADATAPGVPTSLVVTAASIERDEDGKIVSNSVASWNAPVGGVAVAYYRVRVTQSSNGEVRVYETEDTSLTFLVQTGKQYSVQVRAMSIFERPSALTSAVTYTRAKKSNDLPAPGTLVGTPGKKRALISWPAVNDDVYTDYRITYVYRSTTTSAPTPGTTTPYRKTKGDSILDEGLTTGQNYYYWIVHKDNSGNFSALSAMLGPVVSGGNEVTTFADLTGAVAGNQIAAGRGANWLFNSDARLALNFVKEGYDQDNDTTFTLRNDGVWNLVTGPGFELAKLTAGTGVTDVYVTDYSGNEKYFAVVPGRKYEAYMYAGCHRCTAVVAIEFFNAANESIGPTGNSADYPSGYWYSQTFVGNKNGGPALSGYEQNGVIALAPPNAVKCRFIFRKNGTTAGQANSYLFFTHLFGGEAGANQTEFTPWSYTGHSRISEAAVEQTAPTLPTTLAVTFGSLEVDEDGKAVPYAYATWVQPSTTIPVAFYRVKVTQNSNGEVRIFETENLGIVFEVKTGKQYDVQVRAVSIFGKASSYTSIVSYTRPKKAGLPNPPTSVSLVLKPKGILTKWTAPADKDVAYYNIYVGTTSTAGSASLTGSADGTRYLDQEERTVGTPYYYFVTSVDRSGNESSTRVAASNNPQTYRGVDTADISAGAVVDASVIQTAPTMPTTLAVTFGSIEVDEDGKTVPYAKATWVQPSTTIPVAYYLVQVTQNSNSEVRVFKTVALSCVFEVKTGKQYDVQVRSVSSFDKMSAYTSIVSYTRAKKSLTLGALTNVGISPSSLSLTAYRTRGFAIWDTVTDADFAYTEVTVSPTDDITDVTADVYRTQGRTIDFPVFGDAYVFLRHVDRSGNKGPVFPVGGGYHVVSRNLIDTRDFESESVLIWDAVNPAGSETIVSGSPASAITCTSNHTSDAKKVRLSAEFRNVSGGTRTFTLTWRAGTTDLRAVTVTLADNESYSSSHIHGAPSGASTNYNVHITPGATNVVLSERYMTTEALLV